MKKGLVSLAAVGDLHMCGEKPEAYFKHCSPALREADITFGQFEGAIFPGFKEDVYSPQARICCSQTRMAPVLADAGFDVLSLASNHAMDGGPEGLLNTLGLFKKQGINTIGAGKDLKTARQPVIMESKGKKIAFVASCSVAPIGYEATANRPGVAPLRAHTSYESVDYQPGVPPLVRTSCNADDLKAIVDTVRQVRSRADIVIVSFHFGVHLVPEFVSAYEVEAAHAVIDQGADLVLGHHPHILKGIEVYKGKVIFYSLGNFAMDFRGCVKPPNSWFYDSLVRGVTVRGFPWFFLNARDPEGQRLVNPEAHYTMIAKAVLGDSGVERASFTPAIIEGHIPRVLARKDPLAKKVVDYVRRISLSQGLAASFDWDGDEVVITP